MSVVSTDYLGPNNRFLDLILARWQADPEHLVGFFHDGEAWHDVHAAFFLLRVQQFSALLSAHGVRAGDIVLIILVHGVDAHAAFMACMFIGAIPGFMPLPSSKQDPTLYWRHHRDVFSHTKPRAILADRLILEDLSVAADGTGTTILRADLVEETHASVNLSPPGESAIALLQHSSGTTGLKKGVQLSYHAIVEQLSAYQNALGLQNVSGARIVSWLPLYHDMGLMTSFLMPIWLGIPIVSIDPFEWTANPSLFFEGIEAYKATHGWVPNFALLHHVRSVRGNRTWDLSSLRALICCSEPNKPQAFDAFVERFGAWGLNSAALQCCYAMAETVFAVAQTEIGAPARRLAVDRARLQTQGIVTAPRDDGDKIVLLSNGRPIAGCGIRILKDQAFAGEREVGEVCVRATYLFSGYYNNIDATSQAFHEDWFRTGDLGFLDQGEVFIVGRKKDIIIVKGKNITAHDVEATVSGVPAVKPGRVVAFGVYDPSVGSEQLVIVAEQRDSDLDKTAATRLIMHAVFQDTGVSCGDVRVVEKGWLVKTTSGKMSRAENARKYQEYFGDGGNA
jgi:acyl-CoA synthetase (AMP-forming)/AMP-acid ligase II